MKVVKLLSLLIILFFVAILSSEAQEIPNPPVNFNAEITKTNAGQAVKLTWESNDDGIIPDVYNLYMQYGDTEKLVMIGQVHHQDNKRTYEYIFNKFHAGTYTFFAKAAKFDENKKMIESEKSDVITLTIEEQPYIRFESKPIPYAKIGEKYVYEIKASSNIKCKIGFELIDHPDGLQIKDNMIYWVPKKEGEYKVSIKASFPNCETVEIKAIQSFIIRVGSGNNDDPFVKLMIEPILKIKTGQPFQYKVRYETNINCPVNLEFASKVPDGIHLEKGIIIWNHPQPGEYKIAIKATLDCNQDVSDIQHFALVVGEGGDPNHFCANIIGEINFDVDGNPVPDGIVQAWKLDRNDFESKRMFMGEVKNGTFAINLPEGNYALNILGKTFAPEWFEDAKFITDAKRIEIACDDEIKINAKVEPLPQPKLYHISGRVFDAETNEPVPAMVEFIPVQKAYGQLDPNKNNKFATKTDADGNYSIQLPDNFTYIAHAMSAMNSKQYQNNFYNNVTNPTEADLINLTSDLRNIDFAMKLVPHALGGFSGTVKNKEGSPLSAKVIAILISDKDVSHNKKFSQTVETDREGIYHFNHLIHGKYVVMSIPEDRHYIPGYYKLDDYAVLQWKEATIIEVGDMMIEIMYDILHKERSEGGVAQVGGFISANSGSLIKDKDHSQMGEPVAGAFVYVVDTDGNTSDFTFSGSDGIFDLKEVTQGNLMLIADKVGFEPFEIPVETNYDEKANVQLNVQLQEEITGVDDMNNFNKMLLYPIPASNQTMVKFNSNTLKAQIKLLNVQGVVVKLLSESTIKGMNTININVKDLPNGFYFIKISDGRNIQTSPLIILR